MNGPKAYIHTKPRTNSVLFGGQFINIYRLCKDHPDLDRGYVSYILSGERRGSVDILQKLSAALDMTLEDFLACVKERKEMTLEDARRRLA